MTLTSTPILDAGIGENLAAIKQRVAAARAASVDPAPQTHLVAVSKEQPRERILPALDAGQRLFGENRVQEAKAKWPELRSAFPDIELHLIGPLQTNKVGEALALFDAIQSLDRPRLADSLKAEIERRGEGQPLQLFVQVNTGEEPQKSGIAPKDTEDFVRLCRDRMGLPVVGLMCIPPGEENPAPHFALLKALARGLGLNGLSMGMSADFETAIRFGASHVRVGTAMFGARPKAR